MSKSPYYEALKDRRTKLRGPTRDELLALIEEKARGPKSKEILREALEVESPAHLYYLAFECPPVIDKGKGALVWDVDGNEYIDLLAGWAVENIGHSHPRVVEAIKKQCEKLIQYAELPHELRVALAKKLVKITPGDHKKRVLYTTTGGEAVEAAMKFARYYTGGTSIMAFHGCYHGRTYGAMNATSSAYLRCFQGFPLDVGVLHVPYAYCYRCPFGSTYPDCDMLCTKFIEEHFKCGWYGVRYTGPDFSVNNVGALLVEPIQYSSGPIIPPKEFLRDLRRIADDYGLLLIVDEVMAGMGRTGKWWACEHSDIIPDIMTIAKSIAAGIPMGVVVAKAEIMDELGPGAHMTTFGGTPLACAASLEVIKIFEEEKLLDRAAKTGQYFMKGLNDLAENHPLIGNVQGKGLIIGVELVKDQKTKEPATEEFRIIQSECYKKNLILPGGGWYGNIIKVICPLTIEKGQIDKSIEILDEALDKVEK